jgi:hypothetical protein
MAKSLASGKFSNLYQVLANLQAVALKGNYFFLFLPLLGKANPFFIPVVDFRKTFRKEPVLSPAI